MRGICRLLPVIGSLVSAVLGIQMANADTFARDIPDPDTVFVEKTSTRMDVCLNGKWSFRPADESKLPPSEGWGHVSVPSTWDSDWPIVTMAEDGSHFPMDELRKSASAWYQRRVVIPAEADGKRVAVDLRDVSGLATVSIDGKEVGQTRDSGEVDISQAVEPGKACTLSVLIAVASSSPSGKTVFGPVAGGDPESDRGIRGDVFLRIAPRGSGIRHVTMRTSVTKEEWHAIADLERLRTGARYRLLVEALSADGRVAARMERTITAAAPEAEVAAEGAWEGARHWELTDPYLYTCRVRLFDENGKLADESVDRFGFREFGISGGDFVLNGRALRLRPLTFDDRVMCPVVIRAQLSGIKAEGFNTVQYWPYGFPAALEHLAAEADRQGVLLILPLERMTDLIDQFGQGRVDPEWRARVRRQVALVGNHPSVVIWGTNPNVFGTARPPFFVRGAPLQYQYLNSMREATRVALAAYKEIDPTRPVIFHASDAGDVSAPNTYLDMMPLQEQRDYLDLWAGEKAYPLMMVESGLPFFETVMRYRRTVGAGYRSAPFATEAAAIYLGDRAYQLESEEYLRRIETRFRGNEAYENWYYPNPPNQEENLNRMSALFIKERWRAWRTWGISGGMVPWDYRNTVYATSKTSPPEDETTFWIGARSVPGLWPDSLPRGWLAPWTVSGGPDAGYAPAWRPAGTALQEVNRALLVYIGGPAKTHTDHRHNYYSGAMLTRDIIVVYDGDDPAGRRVELKWRVQVGAHDLSSSEKTIRVGSAGDVRVPIRIALPEVHERTSGQITVSADGRQADMYSFTIFPRPAASRLGRRVVVFDPVGLSTKMLAARGVPTQPLHGEPGSGDMLVIGRETLSGDTDLGLDLARAVREGLNVVMFAQPPSFWEERMGWRTSWHVSRTFWISHGAESALAPLRDADFVDWAGTGTLLPPRYEYPEEVVNSYPPPQPVWHCGNRGSVASVALEKPHFGNFTPLLEGEYDLAYSPLLELHYGKGAVYIVQLDLEDNYGLDPAADYLLGAVLKLADAPPADAGPHLLVWNGDAAAGRAHLEQGGNVLVAASTDATVKSAAEALGVALKVDTAHLHGGGTKLPAWPELRGASVSDLHWRGFLDVPVITEIPGGEIAANGLLARKQVGKGMVIVSLATPSVFPIPPVRERRQRPDESRRAWKPEQKTYFRVSRWRTERLLSQLSANLGAGPGDADRVFLDRLAAAPERAEAFDLSGPGWVARHDDGTGEAEAWFRVGLDESGWTPTEVPVPYRPDAPWVQPGACWFRKQFTLPASLHGKRLAVRLSGVDTGEFVYVNGRELVQCIGTRSSYTWERIYFIPQGVVGEENTIVVKTYPDSGNARLTTRPVQIETASYSPFYDPDYDYEDNLYRWMPW